VIFRAVMFVLRWARATCLNPTKSFGLRSFLLSWKSLSLAICLSDLLLPVVAVIRLVLFLITSS